MKFMKARDHLIRDETIISLLHQTIVPPTNSFRDSQPILRNSHDICLSQISKLQELTQDIGDVMNECREIGNENGISWDVREEDLEKGMPTKLEPYDVRVRINGKLRRLNPQEYLRYQQQQHREELSKAVYENMLAKSKFTELVRGLEDTMLLELDDLAKREIKQLKRAQAMKYRERHSKPAQILDRMNKQEIELMTHKYVSLNKANEIVTQKVERAQGSFGSLQIVDKRNIPGKEFFFGTKAKIQEIHSESDQDDILDDMDIDTHPRGVSFMDIEIGDNPSAPRKHESSPVLGRMSLLEHPVLPKYPGALGKNLEVTQIDSPRMEPSRPPTIFAVDNQQSVPTLAQSPSFGQLPMTEQETDKPKESLFRQNEINETKGKSMFMASPFKPKIKNQQLSNLEPQAKEKKPSIFASFKKEASPEQSLKSARNLFAPEPKSEEKSQEPSKPKEEQVPKQIPQDKPEEGSKEDSKKEEQPKVAPPLGNILEKSESSPFVKKEGSLFGFKKDVASPFFGKKKELTEESQPPMTKATKSPFAPKQESDSIFGKKSSNFSTVQSGAQNIFKKAEKQEVKKEFKGWNLSFTKSPPQEPQQTQSSNIFMKAFNKTQESQDQKSTFIKSSQPSQGLPWPQKTQVRMDQLQSTWGSALPKQETGGWNMMSGKPFEAKADWKSSTNSSFTQMRK